MKKNLRLFLVAALAMVFGNAMAEDVIWSEDWTGYDAATNPQGINANYTFTGSVLNEYGTVKSGTKIYEANLAGGEAPELLVAKNGGSFAAVVALGGKSGDLTLAYKTNRGDLTVEVAGATLGEKQRSGNDDVYTVTVPAGTEQITITFKMTTTSNGRLDNIKLYQGQGKKPAGLSWGTSARTVTIGADDNVFPTLSNANNLAITYSSSNAEVATIDAEGVITLVAAGTTVITAESAETDEFEAGKVEYTLTVKEAAAPVDPNAKGQKNNPWLLTDEDFLTLVNGLDKDGNPKSEVCYVKGYITNIDNMDTGSFGNANIKIAAVKGDYDAEMKLLAYRCKYLENTKFTAADQVKLDDEVIICGQIQWYGTGENRVPEIVSCYIYSLNGEVTGIEAVKANTVSNGVMYNLAGQVVNKGYKGLVIMNGKKVVLK